MAVDVTYGSSLPALQFAYQNDTKIIINELNFPLRFEDKNIRHAWALLYTKLMLDGQTIGGDSVEKTRITDGHILVVCKNNVVNKLEYNKLFVFCDKEIMGLPEANKVNDVYDVVDYMNVASLLVGEEESVVRTNDSFVSGVHIIKNGQTKPTQVYVTSQLSKEELNDFEYSDTMAKFKSEHLLEESGFKGFSTGKPDTWRPIILESAYREVKKQMDFYEDTDRIKFIYGH